MDKASHLSVVLDLSPSQWHRSAQPDNPYPLSLQDFLSQLLTFLNMHIASKHENTLAVFGAFPGKSLMLYSTTDDVDLQNQVMDANTYPPFKAVDTSVTQKILQEIEALGEPETEAPCALVGAITKALCYINRITHPAASAPTAASNSAASAAAIAAADPSILPDPRILVLSVSPDLAPAYIPIMNAIFAAQKLRATLDVCKLFGADTVFLQQAAHLTGGSYVFLERRDALLQHLIMSHLPPPAMRALVAVPTQDRVDFRAACFCHKAIVDIGFVCSICLSSASPPPFRTPVANVRGAAVFCKPVPVCTTCRTKFPMKTLQRLNAARPPAASNGGSANGTPRAATPAGMAATLRFKTGNIREAILLPRAYHNLQAQRSAGLNIHLDSRDDMTDHQTSPFLNLCQDCYSGVKAAHPSEGRRLLRLRVSELFWQLKKQQKDLLPIPRLGTPPDFWLTAPFSTDADPWDADSRNRPEMGLIVRTDYGDEDAWGRFCTRLTEAEIEFASAPEDEDEDMAEDAPESTGQSSAQAEDNAMQEDDDESSDEEDSDPPAPIFHIINPSTPTSRSALTGISNLAALRLLNDLEIRPAPKPPAGTKPIKDANRLVDHDGWQEVYSGKQIWVYDAKSNTDGCVRVVNQSGDMYGTAT
ncbi:hypothetical protein HWV62_19003 [Athelia sp. TMB]|nr:hypothetical protein HWV62_19003 [Athelia sp. TMB]